MGHNIGSFRQEADMFNPQHGITPWRTEHVGTAPTDYWVVADSAGHHLRRHYFTREAADVVARQMNL